MNCKHNCKDKATCGHACCKVQPNADALAPGEKPTQKKQKIGCKHPCLDKALCHHPCCKKGLAAVTPPSTQLCKHNCHRKDSCSHACCKGIFAGNPLPRKSKEFLRCKSLGKFKIKLSLPEPFEVLIKSRETKQTENNNETDRFTRRSASGSPTSSPCSPSSSPERETRFSTKHEENSGTSSISDEDDNLGFIALAELSCTLLNEVLGELDSNCNETSTPDCTTSSNKPKLGSHLLNGSSSDNHVENETSDDGDCSDTPDLLGKRKPNTFQTFDVPSQKRTPSTSFVNSGVLISESDLILDKSSTSQSPVLLRDSAKNIFDSSHDSLQSSDANIIPLFPCSSVPDLNGCTSTENIVFTVTHCRISEATPPYVQVLGVFSNIVEARLIMRNSCKDSFNLAADKSSLAELESSENSCGWESQNTKILYQIHQSTLKQEL
jgi:hypothetical protein